MSPLLWPPSPSPLLPLPADETALAVGLARWRDAATGESDPSLATFIRDFAADASGGRLLAAVFGNSPFLTQCCLAEPGFLKQLVESGPDAAFAAVIRDLAGLTPGMDRPVLMAALRIGKRRTALLVALADIARSWSLEQITGALSGFAEAALTVAVRHLLAHAAASGDIRPTDPADPARESGFIILGMGKLGARELNYSSDIDLILLFDPDKAGYVGRRGVQPFFTHLAQELVRLMAERTAQGYVFRTDLRLRPDPASTPPAISIPAALSYYESAGQNWERAAFIKARPVAGDRAAGQDFLDALHPFLWRKHLDFAAIQDIHSIKRQINAQRGGARIAVAGHDVKLGRGGIREIEFFAQTQQLIWGGRMPELRLRGTVATLAALARTGRIGEAAAATMTEAYGFLRRTEHCLQMIDDAQTHRLPTDAAALRRVAIFLGFASADDFADALRHWLAAVESHYAALFEEAPTLAAQGNLVFTGSEDDPDTLQTLSGFGFADPAAVAAIVRGWHHGRYRATRSQRARELLTELVPGLLAAFGASGVPDLAFLRFDQFLSRLPAGVQLFSLLFNNPDLLVLVAEIMGAGTRLAEAVAQQPGLLDSVLTPGFLDPPPPAPALAAELDEMLAGARHYEAVLGAARRWVADRKFQVSVQLLQHRLDGEAAGAAFADIAATALAALLPRVVDEFAQAHGRVAGGEMVVLALGKLGSREMTVTSDLDLILIYDAPASAENSDGARPLAVSAYYARLSQRFINALTVPTGEGRLYEVDMRLRPSGTAGPLASSLAAFRRYYDEAAWAWEEMALTRARLIAGPPTLTARVTAAIHAVLIRPRDPATLVVAVDDMRQRLAGQHRNPLPWDVKHRRGGMVDIEFIAQYAQLLVAARAPEVLHRNIRAALRALGDDPAVGPEAAAELIQALHLWRNVQGLLKLTMEEPFDLAQAPPAMLALLAQGAGAIDFAGLVADMEATATRVAARYQSLIGQPAAAARAAAEKGSS